MDKKHQVIFRAYDEEPRIAWGDRVTVLRDDQGRPHTAEVTDGARVTNLDGEGHGSRKVLIPWEHVILISYDTDVD